MVLAIWSDEIAPYAEDQYCVTLDPETGRCAAGSEQLPERGPAVGHVPVRHHGAEPRRVLARHPRRPRRVPGRALLDGVRDVHRRAAGAVLGLLRGALRPRAGHAHGRDLRAAVAAAGADRRVRADRAAEPRRDPDRLRLPEHQPGPAGLRGEPGRRRRLRARGPRGGAGLHPAVLPGDPQPHAVGARGGVRRGRPLPGRHAAHGDLPLRVLQRRAERPRALHPQRRRRRADAGRPGLPGHRHHLPGRGVGGGRVHVRCRTSRPACGGPRSGRVSRSRCWSPA